MPSRFRLGQRVRFTDTVKKTHGDNKTTYVSNGLPYDFTTDTPQRPDAGVIVGERTLFDYELKTYMEGGDDFFSGSYQITTPKQVKGSGRKAWIISFDLRRKPVLALDTDVEPDE